MMNHRLHTLGAVLPSPCGIAAGPAPYEVLHSPDLDRCGLPIGWRIFVWLSELVRAAS